MDDSLRRDIILDNYNNPLNREAPNNKEGYFKFNSRNNSCIDNLDIYIKIEDNIIRDIKYTAEACVICISSTSILSDLLIGKTLKEAEEIINNYHNMVEEKEYDEKKLASSVVFSNIYKQPSRKNCATLFTKGIEKELNKLKNS